MFDLVAVRQHFDQLRLAMQKGGFCRNQVEVLLNLYSPASLFPHEFGGIDGQGAQGWKGGRG